MQREFTRDLVLQTLAGLLSSKGLSDFTTQELSERSGISTATIYRLFPDRDTLLREFLQWADRQIREKGAKIDAHDIRDLAQASSQNYSVFEETREISGGMLRLYDAGDPLIDAELSARRQHSSALYEEVLSEVARAADPRTVKVLSVLLPYLSSIRMWRVFHEHPGISTREAACVVAQVFDLIVEALRQGRFKVPEQHSEI